MFELFKTRAFADYISDTFQFLKIYGKHYFKNYLKFAFVALLISMVSIAISSIFYSRIFSTSFGITTEQNFDNSFVTENAVVLFFSVVILILAALYLIILSFSFPLYYMRLIGENPEEKPKLDSIRSLFKKDFGRMLRFGFISVILNVIVSTLTIIAIVFGQVGFILFLFSPSYLLLGFIFILLFPILITFLIIWYILTFFYYGNDNLHFFTATRRAFKTIIKNFWKIIGVNICMMIIVNILSTAATIIPYIFMVFGYIFGIADMKNLDTTTLNSSTSIGITIIMLIIFCISYFVSLLLYHLILIQNNLIYYSERENTEQHSLRQSIDEIGNNYE
ncbi:MAG TPA: hypothetical protein VKY33_00805 [Flavobacterium sp.]|nr:hypothetical protein [Flavobacterium sp.]